MNLLLSYASVPHTTAVYFERAFRKLGQVVTYGPTFDRHALGLWNIESLSGHLKDHEIVLDQGSARELKAALPPGWVPDWCLFIETGLLYPLSFMDSLSCPKACYLIDTHLHQERHIEMARSFDLVFLAQREFVTSFQERLDRPVFWIPLACDPEIHRPYPEEEVFDIVFAGSFHNPQQERVRRLKRLALRFSVQANRVFLEDMSRFLSKGRLLFNAAVRNDLNMRVFESLAIGKCLLTDEVPGLSDFFTPGIDLMVYDERDLVEKAWFLLENPDVRKEMALSGREKVLARHTYLHRAAEMNGIVGKEFGAGSTNMQEGDQDEAYTHV
jgi:hypothetical protein